MTVTIIVLIFGIAAWISYDPKRSSYYMATTFIGAVIVLSIIAVFIWGVKTQREDVSIWSGNRIEKGDK